MNLNIKVTPSFEKVGNVFKQIKLGPAIAEGMKAISKQGEGEAKKSATDLIYNQPMAKTYVRTGRLRASIFGKYEPARAIIAPHVHYAIYVEKGTRRMRARPFMEEGAKRIENYLKTTKNPLFREINKYLEVNLKTI